MKITLLILASILGLVHTNAQTLNWLHTIGGTNFDYNQSTVIDYEGNVITAAYIDSPSYDSDPNPGVVTETNVGNGSCIRKVTPNGTLYWSKAFGSDSQFTIKSITSSPDGSVYATGTFIGTSNFDVGATNFTMTSASSGMAFSGFIAKYSETGVFQWAHKFDGSGSFTPLNIQAFGNGDVLVSGTLFGEVDLDFTATTTNVTPVHSNDLLCVRYSGTSNLVSSTILEQNYNSSLVHVAMDAAEDIYVLTQYSGTIDVGTTALTAVSGWARYLVKFDGISGNVDYVQDFGQVWANGVGVSPSGEAFVIGNFNTVLNINGNPISTVSNQDIFIAKFLASGVLDQVLTYGVTGFNNGFGIAIGNNKVFLACLSDDGFDADPSAQTAQLTAQGIDDSYIILELDEDLNYSNHYQFGGYPLDNGDMLRVDGDTLIAIGYFEGTTNLSPVGSFFLTSEGSFDGFAISLNLGTSASIEENTGSHFTIYPNPSSSNVTLSFNTEEALFTLTDLNGKELMSKMVFNNETVDVSNFEKGIYIVKIDNGTQRLVIN